MTALPRNELKHALLAGERQFGLFSTLAAPLPVEVMAVAGADFVVIDAEHAPNDLPAILAQLHALGGYPCSAVVRPPCGEPWVLKQVLDAGAQTVLVPMVDTAEQAAGIVAAINYPPNSIRGVAAARAARWGQVPDYYATAREELLLVLQVETVEGLRNLDAICEVDGVDAVFLGPSDLAASLGHLGEPGHPEVVAEVTDAIRRVTAHGVLAGAFAATRDAVAHYAGAGATLVTCGVDAIVLAGATRRLLDDLRDYSSGQN